METMTAAPGGTGPVAAAAGTSNEPGETPAAGQDTRVKGPRGVGGRRERLADSLRSLADRLSGDPRGGGKRPGRVWGWRRVVTVVVVLIVAVVALAFIIGGSNNSGGSDTRASAPAPAVEPGSGESAPGGADSPTGSTADDAASGRSALSGPAAPSSGVVPPKSDSTVGGPSDAARPAGAQPKIVRDGAIALEVKGGGVDRAVEELTNAVTQREGYVSASQTSAADDGASPSANLTLRVPSASYDDFTNAVRKIGTVRSATTSSRDVTGQYTDLEARLRALEASRSTYLTMLGKATTIGETLSVQQQIDNIQVRIEQIEGQRQVLADSADLATLTVRVREEGQRLDTPSDDGSGFVDAFQRSWDRFTGGLKEIIALVGPLALVVLVIGIVVGLFLLGRGITRRMRGTP